MESALYGIYALVRCAYSFDFWYVNNSCVNTVRQHFPWSILYVLNWLHNEHSYRRRPNKSKQPKQISLAYHWWKSLMEGPHSWNLLRRILWYRCSWAGQAIKFVSMHTAIIEIYKGLIKPHFDYYSTVWDGLTQQLSEKL